MSTSSSQNLYSRAELAHGKHCLCWDQLWHLSRALDGDAHLTKASSQCPTTPPEFEHDLGSIYRGNEHTQRFVWPQKAQQAFPHQQGGFRESVSEGIWSFNNKSILSALKQCSAGCLTQDKESSADREWNEQLVSLTWVSLETSVSLSDNKMPHTSTHFQESLQNHLMVVRETKLKQI